MTRLRRTGRVTVDAAMCTDPGRVHPHNEDACLVETGLGLFAVADGVGGQPAGEVAARLAVARLPGLVRRALAQASPSAEGAAVARALVDLNGVVLAEAAADPNLAGMGTTVVLALVAGHSVHLAHLGDSRAYLLRQGGLRRLTEDHSLATALVRGGVLDADQAGRHPFARHLTQAVGLADVPEPAVRRLDLVAGDRLLLCSDGVSTMLADDRIAAILGRHARPKAACRALVDAANDAGGRDNISAVVVDVPRGRRQLVSEPEQTTSR